MSHTNVIDSTVHRPIVCAGTPLYANVRLRNDTHKDLKSIRLSLIRRIKTFSESAAHGAVSEKNLLVLARKVMTEKVVLLKDYGLQNGRRKHRRSTSPTRTPFKEVMLDLLVPPGLASIRHTSLINVSYVLQVAISASYKYHLHAFVHRSQEN